MKTIISIVALMLTLPGTLCGAENEKILQINEDGEVFETERRWALSLEQLDAFNSPGKKIPLFTRFWLEKENVFWGYSTKKAYKSLIREGEEMKIKTINEEVVVRGGPFFLWYVPFFALAISLKVFENRIVFRNFGDWHHILKSFVPRLVFIVGVICLSAATISAGLLFGMIAAALGLLAILTLIFPIVVCESNKRSYWISSIIFYIVCATALVV